MPRKNTKRCGGGLKRDEIASVFTLARYFFGSNFSIAARFNFREFIADAFDWKLTLGSFSALSSLSSLVDPFSVLRTVWGGDCPM